MSSSEPIIIQQAWIPTGKERRIAALLGIDIEEWPNWLGEALRRSSLRELAAELTALGEPITYEWVRRLAKSFGLSAKASGQRGLS